MKPLSQTKKGTDVVPSHHEVLVLFGVGQDVAAGRTADRVEYCQ